MLNYILWSFSVQVSFFHSRKYINFLSVEGRLKMFECLLSHHLEICVILNVQLLIESLA